MLGCYEPRTVRTWSSAEPLRCCCRSVGLALCCWGACVTQGASEGGLYRRDSLSQALARTAVSAGHCATVTGRLQYLCVYYCRT